MEVEGSLDRCDAEAVAGWVRFPDDPERRAELRVYAGSRLLGTCVADVRRQDLVDAGVGDGQCAFRFVPPPDLTEADVSSVLVRIVGTDYLFRSGFRWVLHEPPETAAARTSKRFRTCILHIGAEKTGTTSLQSFFWLNRRALQDKGYFVPESLAPYRDQGVLNHVHLAMYAMDDARYNDDVRRSLGVTDAASLHTYRQSVEAVFADEVADLHPGCDDIILSNEHCHSRLLLPVEIQRLKSLLDPFCSEYEVVVYLRAQHELAMSQYGMFVANGVCNIDMFPPLPPPPGYAKLEYTSLVYFDYDDLLERWSAVFGRGAIHPRIYSRELLRGRDIIDDFMQFVPISIEELVRPEPRNANFSENAQRFLIKFYEYFGDPARPGAAQVRERVRNALQVRFPGHGIMPARAAVAAFLERFRDSNERVRRRWFPERARLFDVDLAQFPLSESPVELSTDELYHIFIELLFTEQEQDFSLTSEQILELALNGS